MHISSILPFLLGCTVPNADWDVRAALPESYFPAATRMLAGRVTLFGGYLQGGDTWAIQDRTATVLRWDGAAPATVWTGRGWVVDLAVQGDIAWLLAGTLKASGADSDYSAARSLDRGLTWQDLGPVTVPNAERLLVVSRDEAWVLGPGVLGRTTDGGQSWSSVVAPGRRNSVEERLVGDADNVLIVGDGVRATNDGGSTWLDNDVDGSHVEAVAGSLVLARSGGKLRLGRMEPGTVRWISTFPAGLSPFRLVASGSTIRFLATPAAGHSGVVLYQSVDNGKSWKARRVASDGGSSGADIDLSSGVAMDVRRRILSP